MQQVKQRWFDLTGYFFTDETAGLLWNQLAALYSEPRRAYHNLIHIADCFDKLDQVSDKVNNRLQMELAVFYHDVIYDPKAKNNEQASAEFAAETLSRAGLPNSEIGWVTRLILDTRHQEVAQSADGRLLVDVDLTILGADGERFATYDRAIRQEYAFVEDEAYRTGRAKIMQGFLDRDQIYSTGYFYEKYEAQARKNLIQLIKTLTSM